MLAELGLMAGAVRGLRPPVPWYQNKFACIPALGGWVGRQWGYGRLCRDPGAPPVPPAPPPRWCIVCTVPLLTVMHYTAALYRGGYDHVKFRFSKAEIYEAIEKITQCYSDMRKSFQRLPDHYPTNMQQFAGLRDPMLDRKTTKGIFFQMFKIRPMKRVISCAKNSSLRASRSRHLLFVIVVNYYLYFSLILSILFVSRKKSFI